MSLKDFWGEMKKDVLEKRLLKEVEKMSGTKRLNCLKKALLVPDRIIYIVEPESQDNFIHGGIYVWYPKKPQLLYFEPYTKQKCRCIEDARIVVSAYQMYNEIGIKESLKWGYKISKLPYLSQIGIFDRQHGVWFEACFAFEGNPESKAFQERIQKYQ